MLSWYVSFLPPQLLKYNTVRKIKEVLEKVNLLMQGMKFKRKSYFVQISCKIPTKSQKD